MTDFRFGNERIAGVAARIPVVKFGPPPPHRHHWLIRPDDLLVFDVQWVNLKLEPGEDGEDGKPARLHRAHAGDAFLIVTLPPQHITEIAYFTTAPEFEQKQTLSAQIAQQIANLAVAEEATQESTPSSPLFLDVSKVAEALQSLLSKDPSSDEPLDDPPIKAIIAGWSRLAFKVSDDVLPIDWTSAGILAAIRELELNVAATALPRRPPCASSDRTSTSRPVRSSSRPKR